MRTMRIRELRESAGYTRDYLAQSMGVAICTVTQWELGNKNPRASKLPKLAALLHCSIGDLYADHEAS